MGMAGDKYEEDWTSKLRSKKNEFSQIFNTELRRVVRGRC